MALRFKFKVEVDHVEYVSRYLKMCVPTASDVSVAQSALCICWFFMHTHVWLNAAWRDDVDTLIRLCRVVENIRCDANIDAEREGGHAKSIGLLCRDALSSLQYCWRNMTMTEGVQLPVLRGAKFPSRSEALAYIEALPHAMPVLSGQLQQGPSHFYHFRNTI